MNIASFSRKIEFAWISIRVIAADFRREDGSQIFFLVKRDIRIGLLCVEKMGSSRIKKKNAQILFGPQSHFEIAIAMHECRCRKFGRSGIWFGG
jgi:hypothetical protein